MEEAASPEAEDTTAEESSINKIPQIEVDKLWKSDSAISSSIKAASKVYGSPTNSELYPDLEQLQFA